MAWNPIPKPAEIAESRLLEAILDGTFAINSCLPGERDLAAQIGVTRPTLREAMQRLARDGWIDIQHGKATRVRDYWHEGSLAVLGVLAESPQGRTPDFVAYLMEIRLLLAPAYTRQALESAASDLLELLKGADQLEPEPVYYAQFDWELHSLLTQRADNPVFRLLLNSFKNLYLGMAARYFGFDECRQHSRNFYTSLRNCIQSGQLCDAETLTCQTMAESLDLWKRLNRGEA